jgi:zinc protease
MMPRNYRFAFGIWLLTACATAPVRSVSPIVDNESDESESSGGEAGPRGLPPGMQVAPPPRIEPGVGAAKRSTPVPSIIMPSAKVESAIPNEAPSIFAALPQSLRFPVEPFRNTQPAASAPRAFQLPGIHRFKLDALDTEVFLVERHELPTVSMTMTFAGGATNDPVGKEGQAEICMSLLEEGTRRLDKIAFDEALADTASTLSAWASLDQLGVGLSTLSRNLDSTLDLWIEMLFEPGLRESDRVRLVERRIEALKQQKGAVASVASRLSGHVVYGPKHALGRLETETSYGSISLKDCSKHYKDWLKPGGTRLFVVGDIDENGIRQRVQTRLVARKWQGKAARTASFGKIKPLSGRIFFVGIPGSQQSALYLTYPGPNRNAPDYFATDLMASVFGGGFAGRLNMNLREDKGWAYGARGGFTYHRQGSTFVASASVQTDHTQEALAEMLRELTALSDGSAPVKPAELEREKNGSTLALPAGFATRSAVLQRYRDLLYYGLPLDYYNTYVASIQAVTTEEIARAARTHLRPNDLQVLVVGDPDKVQPTLKTLWEKQTFGPGDLVVLDADGKELSRLKAPRSKPKKK